ncbi:hypothetical protein GCM10007860_27030 [Chitiniphilus shinanonensis]|uniref:Uncharacterized protein n=1 Tax=Chitiniphilus shinanonensis TaxID=553088 RepID=A0ABQ6BV45_9NEIS|nr:hypothetical protein [Chitiniphilus shinanonensis]GLS05549.1 hypothetical protein GCM10007860_27030 [Chitiniphilus shinanonensis]
MNGLDDAERWARVRAKGWRHAFFWRGTVVWGVSFAVLFSAVESMTGRAPDYFLAVLDNLPFGFVAGTVYGMALWGYAQLQYVKQKHAKEQ